MLLKYIILTSIFRILEKSSEPYRYCTMYGSKNRTQSSTPSTSKSNKVRNVE